MTHFIEIEKILLKLISNRKSKIELHHREFIVQEIERNPLITLSNLVDLLHAKKDLVITKEAVRLVLNGMMYTLKKSCI